MRRKPRRQARQLRRADAGDNNAETAENRHRRCADLRGRQQPGIVTRRVARQHDHISRIKQRAGHGRRIAERMASALPRQQADAKTGKQRSADHRARRLAAKGEAEQRHHQHVQAGQECATVRRDELQAIRLRNIRQQREPAEQRAVAPDLPRRLWQKRRHAQHRNDKAQRRDFSATQARSGGFHQWESRSPDQSHDEQ